MTDDMMARRRRFSNAKRYREEDRRFPVAPGGALKAGPTCTCFPTISLFVLVSRIHAEGAGVGGLRGATAGKPDSGSLGGRERPRLGEAATLCSCLLCAAKPCPPAGLGGDLGKTYSF